MELNSTKFQKFSLFGKQANDLDSGAPATLVSNLFKTGIPLVIKDRKLYWDLYLGKSLEAEDFLEFAESY